jgi:hypothetical protein
MVLRENFVADWAFAISGSIGEMAEKMYPQQAHSWPLVNSFYTEGFLVGDYVVIVLRDRLRGIPAGGGLKILKNSEVPQVNPTQENLDVWFSFMLNTFSLQPKDAAFVLPAKDSGNVKDEWSSWDENEKQMWHLQVLWAIARYAHHLGLVITTPGFQIPQGYEFLVDPCKEFFKDHPDYTKNIFVMMKLPEGDQLLERIANEIRKVLTDHGLNGVIADDRMYMKDRNLWNNICVYMICCSGGIAVLEDRIKDEFNPNVAMEYGFMRGINKPALLLVDKGFRNIRPDIVGTLRETFDILDVENTIRRPIEKWLAELDFLSSE